MAQLKVHDPAAIGPVDLVIFAVKLYDAEAAAQATRPLIGPQTGVVTFQNGVDSSELLARALGPEHVIGGVAHIAAVIAEPGVILHTGTLASFVFGELDGGRSERVAALATALQAAAVDHRVSEDIRRDIWDKMAFLATFAGLTALMPAYRPDPGRRREARHAAPGARRSLRRRPRQGRPSARRLFSSARSSAATACPTS